MGMASNTKAPPTKEAWSLFLKPFFIELMMRMGTRVTMTKKYAAAQSGRSHDRQSLQTFLQHPHISTSSLSYLCLTLFMIHVFE